MPSLGQRTQSDKGFSTCISACRCMYTTSHHCHHVRPGTEHRFTLPGTTGWEAILDQLQRQPSTDLTAVGSNFWESESCSHFTCVMLRVEKNHLVLPCFWHAIRWSTGLTMFDMLSSCHSCHCSLNLACCTLSWKSRSEPGRFGRVTSVLTGKEGKV